MDDSKSRPTFEHLSVVLLLLGVLLIATSFIPFTSLSRRGWTTEDSLAFGQVTRELHQSTQESPEKLGRTAEELTRYRENLEKEFSRLNSKLQQAQAEPERWSRVLWWSGVTLAAVGGLMHFAKSSSQTCL